MRRVLAIAAAAALLGGCGSSRLEGGAGDPAKAKRTALVDLEATPPYINTLDLDPKTGDVLLSTNRGFFRIDPAKDSVKKITGRITARGRSSTVGTFLAFLPTGDGRLLASGHPDTADLPTFLGFFTSQDDGQNWKVVSRFGQADLHKLVVAHDRLYAFDAVLGAMLISADEGKTFEEHFTPRGLVIDFVVDPEDPEHLVAATEDQLYQSSDEGERWRGIRVGTGMRLAWADPQKLFLAEKDGTFSVSSDAGKSFEKLSTIDGEPYKIKLDGERILVALADATIVESTDGGKSFQPIFEP